MKDPSKTSRQYLKEFAINSANRNANKLTMNAFVLNFTILKIYDIG